MSILISTARGRRGKKRKLEEVKEIAQKETKTEKRK